SPGLAMTQTLAIDARRSDAARDEALLKRYFEGLAAQASGAVTTSSAKMETRINILMVDDQPNNLVALDAVLAAPHLNLVKAHSGPEALRHLLHDDFALILMDVLMPE